MLASERKQRHPHHHRRGVLLIYIVEDLFAVNMGSWWRSEEMTYVSLILSEEAAPACVRELGVMVSVWLILFFNSIF